jgi:hypothetical protein
MELVQNTPDFKLAEYARRGFGELVTVAALVLPILLDFALAFAKRQFGKRKNLPRFGGRSNRFAVRDNDFGGAEIVSFDRKFRLRFDDGSVLSDGRDDLARARFRLVCADGFARRARTIRLGRAVAGAVCSRNFARFQPDDFIVRTNVRLMQRRSQFRRFL